MSAYGRNGTKRSRQREEGDSRRDHMTQSIVILSEKGLEWSIPPSGRGRGEKWGERGKATQGWREQRSEGAKRMRASIERVPATSAPVGTTIKLPQDRTMYARRSQRRREKEKPEKYVRVNGERRCRPAVPTFTCTPPRLGSPKPGGGLCASSLFHMLIKYLHMLLLLTLISTFTYSAFIQSAGV